MAIDVAAATVFIQDRGNFPVVEFHLLRGMDIVFSMARLASGNEFIDRRRLCSLHEIGSGPPVALIPNFILTGRRPTTSLSVAGTYGVVGIDAKCLPPLIGQRKRRSGSRKVEHVTVV